MYHHFPFQALADHLQPLYQQAKGQLERYKQRIKRWTEQYGFAHPDQPDKMLLCPLIRHTALATLPRDEPLNEPGVGGAPPIPFQAMLTAWVLAPYYEAEDNAAALWRALARNPLYHDHTGLPSRVEAFILRSSQNQIWL